ncbi:MAG: hypothetical protein B7X75_02085 [Sphingobacteriales bacterium 39-40-5]|nr:MAG: hypothetical protein B7X75_02085 [Sphingobacteriales bacterium 39-40-5]
MLCVNDTKPGKLNERQIEVMKVLANHVTNLLDLKITKIASDEKSRKIKSQNEAFDIGFEEYLASGEYCFIEWPQNISDLWPQHYIKLKISEGENGLRNIDVNRV